MSGDNDNEAGTMEMGGVEENALELEEVGVEEAPNAPAPTIAPEEGKSMAVADVDINHTRLSLFVVLIASVVLLIATGHNYDWDVVNIGAYSGYAISVSSVTMALSFIGLALTKFAHEKLTRVGEHLNVINFVYSFIGACFLTFDKPFDQTSNGYFAAWTIVYGCAMAMGMTSKAFGSTIKGLGAVMGLFASSLVVILASIAPIRDEMNKSEAMFALVLSCVTFVFILFILGLDKMDKPMPHIASLLAFAILTVCWIIMASLVTFRGPFEVTGNGYFASWAGAVTASVATFAAKEALVDKEEVGAEDAPAPAPTESHVRKQFPLFVVLIASIVLMVATGVNYEWNISNIGGYSGYAITVSSVAIIFSSIGLLLARFAEEMFSTIGERMNILNFLYSLVGACFLTFDKPFDKTGNGYFAAWAVVYGCAMGMDMTSEAFVSTAKGPGTLMTLLVSSLVVILACITPIRDEIDTNTAIFALVIGCVTLAMVLIAMALDKKDRTMRALDHAIALSFLAVCWIIMACLVTFRGPFEVTGNGYFASWIGAATATMASFSALHSVAM